MHRRPLATATATAVAFAAFALPAGAASASARAVGPAVKPAVSSLQTHCSVGHKPRHLRHSRRR